MAHDGPEALELAGEFRPEVVLLDIGIPGMDGYEVARHIRQHEWGERMKLVALTGWGQETDRQRAWDAGFDAHLTKPVDHDRLNELLAD